MIISSRTPEGESARCPLCRAEVRVEPSVLFGDATCPRCGSLLWIVTLTGERVVYERAASRSLRERAIDVIAQQLNVPREKIAAQGDTIRFVNDLGADSLDMVELVMELEAEFDAA